MHITISVRRLVEFILREGDIDQRFSRKMDQAMQEGARLHRKIQKSKGSSYRAEVSLCYVYDAGEYDIVVEGRADGIETIGGDTVVDEIKCTYANLRNMKEVYGLHLAQAKCYAFFYAHAEAMDCIGVQLTYCNIETEDQKYFTFQYTYNELQLWYEGLMQQYRIWADFEREWKEFRILSIRNLQFPYPYREGQKELITYVYQTIYHSKKLYLQAPTGVGKTLSTIFPAVKAMGEGLCDKIFYLTAKTITRTVATEAIEQLRAQKLLLKSVEITAKEKICANGVMECDPEHCNYAKGHYDRINAAIYDLLTSEDRFHRDSILEIAFKHQVCPFELSLDMSLFADLVVCDYNYVFDPHVYLRRFFGEEKQGNYLFLVDEAHNLVERGRRMYSAQMVKEDLLALKALIKGEDDKLTRALEGCNREMLTYKRECEGYLLLPSLDGFILKLYTLLGRMEDYLGEPEGHHHQKEVLQLYFLASHFLAMYEEMEHQYRMYCILQEDGSFVLHLFCVNPSPNLEKCMKRGRSTILFSATLLPIRYYRNLLGAQPEDYDVYARTAFSSEQLGVFVAEDVTTKYSRRGVGEYYSIATYIYRIVCQKQGNYMIFFPSYAMLHQIQQQLAEQYPDLDHLYQLVVQRENMQEREKEEFLASFQAGSERYCLGMCVTGGIFGEGIDLQGDRLIGAIVVGTNLPQLSLEGNIVASYFDEEETSGFDYAYRYPGMNKVLQSAGRVIRTTKDVGIVVLLDERFWQSSYRSLFPREWSNPQKVNLHTIAEKVKTFWESHNSDIDSMS